MKNAKKKKGRAGAGCALALLFCPDGYLAEFGDAWNTLRLMEVIPNNLSKLEEIAMTDWMTVDEAWCYMHHHNKPVKGLIVHTARNTNNFAWFVPEGKTQITSGWTLWDEEGVADETGVWYREEVPMNVAYAAMRKYWQNKLDLIGIEATGIRRILKELGIMEKEENGAE